MAHGKPGYLDTGIDTEFIKKFSKLTNSVVRKHIKKEKLVLEKERKERHKKVVIPNTNQMYL